MDELDAFLDHVESVTGTAIAQLPPLARQILAMTFVTLGARGSPSVITRLGTSQAANRFYRYAARHPVAAATAYAVSTASNAARRPQWAGPYTQLVETAIYTPVIAHAPQLLGYLARGAENVLQPQIARPASRALRWLSTLRVPRIPQGLFINRFTVGAGRYVLRHPAALLGAYFTANYLDNTYRAQPLGSWSTPLITAGLFPAYVYGSQQLPNALRGLGAVSNYTMRGAATGLEWAIGQNAATNTGRASRLLTWAGPRPTISLGFGVLAEYFQHRERVAALQEERLPSLWARYPGTGLGAGAVTFGASYLPWGNASVRRYGLVTAGASVLGLQYSEAVFAVREGRPIPWWAQVPLVGDSLVVAGFWGPAATIRLVRGGVASLFRHWRFSLTGGAVGYGLANYFFGHEAATFGAITGAFAASHLPHQIGSVLRLLGLRQAAPPAVVASATAVAITSRTLGTGLRQFGGSLLRGLSSGPATAALVIPEFFNATASDIDRANYMQFELLPSAVGIARAVQTAEIALFGGQLSNERRTAIAGLPAFERLSIVPEQRILPLANRSPGLYSVNGHDAYVFSIPQTQRLSNYYNNILLPALNARLQQGLPVAGALSQIAGYGADALAELIQQAIVALIASPVRDRWRTQPRDTRGRFSPGPIIPYVPPLQPTFSFAQVLARINQRAELQRAQSNANGGTGLQERSHSLSAPLGHANREFWLYRGRDRRLMEQTLRDLLAIQARDAFEATGKKTTKLSIRQQIFPRDVPGLTIAVSQVIAELKYKLSLVRVRGSVDEYESIYARG